MDVGKCIVLTRDRVWDIVTRKFEYAKQLRRGKNVWDWKRHPHFLYSMDHKASMCLYVPAENSTWTEYWAAGLQTTHHEPPGLFISTTVAKRKRLNPGKKKHVTFQEENCLSHQTGAWHLNGTNFWASASRFFYSPVVKHEDIEKWELLARFMLYGCGMT